MATNRAVSGPTLHGKVPDASTEEVAAIMAAIEVVWPRPHHEGGHVDASRWRFSGRWWSKPVPVRRDRPW
jgi:hypothetical protein